ncbi:DUF3859 domain-containing protein [Sagittula salina]|uniref:DUF3859 domain-containing protein n=1 Tax=Sagittula salina TaxID=2820268 RepID=A0A940S1T2_9RHOB|nr:DUF3859 domain-containing protein [Sagittula salina]MBP0483426.1 DUF3859 domain-containing protein [Sagittula salina]
MLRRILALFLFAAPALADVDGDIPARLVEFGVICDLDPTDRRPEPGTVSGVLNLVTQSAPFDVPSTQVPAEIGLSFGIRAKLAPDAPPGDYRMVVTHPPMGPQGQVLETWSAGLIPGDPALNLFTFEEGWELIEGPWRFQLVLDDRVLLQQDFTVTPKGTVPAVQKTCNGDLIMS